jgi:hypothetical protein
MVSVKGLLLGVGFAFLGSLIFAIRKMYVLSRTATMFATGPRAGVDIRVLKSAVLQNPAYWLMILLMLAAGCAVVYFWRGQTS